LNKQVQPLGTNGKGIPFIVSAPAGTGKTTLIEMLLKEFSCVVESLSYTTRAPRPQEKDGVDYRFVSEEQFQERIAAGEFIEYVQLFDHYYGTSKMWVQERLDAGDHVLLDIDVEGALRIKELKALPVVMIFLTPPSLEELERRIRGRKTESEEMIQKRLARAKREMAVADQYDYVVVNDDIDVAYDVLRSILIAEEHKIKEEK